MARRKRNVELTTINIQVNDKKILQVKKLHSSEQLDAVIHRLILMTNDEATAEWAYQEQVKITQRLIKELQELKSQRDILSYK